MDGRFGNYPSAWMVVQTGLPFISKLRSDAALYEPFTGKYCGRGARPKYGDKVDARQMKKKYLKSDKRADGIRAQIYQALLRDKGFGCSINVVVILKTNLATGKQARVILFGTDLNLDYEKRVDYYAPRFQIEFNCRDAKQYWGLDDFIPHSVENCAFLEHGKRNFQPWVLYECQERDRHQCG